MQNHMPHVRTVTGIEADDAMAIDHTETGGKSTIICSRDKDLRQVPGWFFSWELGAQPKFGPVFIEEPGTLEYNKEKKKLSGTGFAFFCAQVMMGDTVDNIPGLPGCGPAKAYAALAPILDMSCDSVDEVKDVLWDEVQDQYHGEYGNIDWMKPLEEQARLCWIVRRMQPVMFNGPSS
jgi:5'-3' exonuclease